MNTNKTRTNKQARVATTAKSTPAKSRVREITPAIDPIAALQADVAQLTQAVAALLANAGAHVPAPAQAKSRTRVAAKPDAEAKKQAHREKTQAYAQARESWAGKDWASCVKLAAAEIRRNRNAGTRNANIADANSNRVWLSSTTNQALMAARKTHAVAYAEMEQALAKAAK